MGATRARTQKPPQAGVTLDAGALIALERGNRRMIALLRELAASGRLCHIPSGALAQAWRGGARQGTLARFLRSPQVEVRVLDEASARACGELCSAAGTKDVVDASVVLVAREHGDAIITSDPRDLRRLDPSATIEKV